MASQRAGVSQLSQTHVDSLRNDTTIHDTLPMSVKNAGITSPTLFLRLFLTQPVSCSDSSGSPIFWATALFLPALNSKVQPWQMISYGRHVLTLEKRGQELVQTIQHRKSHRRKDGHSKVRVSKFDRVRLLYCRVASNVFGWSCLQVFTRVTCKPQSHHASSTRSLNTALKPEASQVPESGA